jgi:hypothetical protein
VRATIIISRKKKDEVHSCQYNGFPYVRIPSKLELFFSVDGCVARGACWLFSLVVEILPFSMSRGHGDEEFR